MFERRRERILLILVLALLVVVVLQPLVIKPLWSSLSSVDEDIARLKEDIHRNKRVLEEDAAILKQTQLIAQRIRLANEQGQNEFRQYIESEAGKNVIKSSTPKAEADLPDQEDLKLLTYDLTLEGTIEELRTFLERLDRSGELLRTDRVQVSNASQEDRTVTMKMTVSTIAARKPIGLAGKSPETRPAIYRTATPVLAPLTKNIFFPLTFGSGRYYAGVMTEGQFILAGTIVTPRQRKALLSYPASKSTRWTYKGDQLGQMTVIDITSDGIVLDRYGQTVSLGIGRSSMSLDVTKLYTADSFELLGVCKTEKSNFALVKLLGDNSVHQVALNEQLAEGILLKIQEDHIVLQSDDEEHVIPVGGRYTSKGSVQ